MGRWCGRIVHQPVLDGGVGRKQHVIVPEPVGLKRGIANRRVNPQHHQRKDGQAQQKVLPTATMRRAHGSWVRRRKIVAGWVRHFDNAWARCAQKGRVVGRTQPIRGALDVGDNLARDRAATSNTDSTRLPRIILAPGSPRPETMPNAVIEKKSIPFKTPVRAKACLITYDLSCDDNRRMHCKPHI